MQKTPQWKFLILRGWPGICRIFPKQALKAFPAHFESWGIPTGAIF
jgi:hypothetical protein